MTFKGCYFRVMPVLLLTLVVVAPMAFADELRIAIPGDIKGTNPGVTRDGNTDTVIHHVVESLVAYRKDLTVAPMLAQDFDVSDDLARYTFHLRRDVVFHNGAPLTAREVQWSWQRMLDPNTWWRCRHWYDGSSAQGVKIESITAPDPYTLVFQLASPSSIFLDRMANVQCVTAILHPDSVTAEGKWIEPVATGPYRIREWRRGEYILLQRFDDYHSRPEPRDGYVGARRALVEQLRFLVVGDAAVGVAGILSGGIDILPQLPLHLAADFERRSDVRVQGQGLLGWSVLLMQRDDPLLKDRRIRQAIAHAIDIKQVARISSFGHATANPSAVPVYTSYHTPVHDEWWEYNPERARALLQEAGYRGQTLRIQANRKIPFIFENAVAVQAMLTAAGFNARLEVLDWATQLANFFTGNFQLSAFSYSGRTHPSLAYDAFLGNKSQMPNLQWQSTQATLLLDQVESISDPDRQRQLFEQIHLTMREDIPLIGLFNEYTVDVVRSSIEGYEPFAIGRPRLWGVTKSSGDNTTAVIPPDSR